MALTRKFLSALGIEADKVEEIIEAHTETVEGLKNQLNQYKEDAESLKAVQKELNDTKKELEKAKSGDDWKQKYEDEHKAYEDYKKSVADEKVMESKKNAYIEVLKDAGITADKSIAKILKYTNLTDLKLNEDGKFENAQELLKSVKEEWPEHIVKEGQKGASTATPPSNSGGSSFDSMNLADKMRYVNAHPDDQAVKAWLAKK